MGANAIDETVLADDAEARLDFLIDQGVLDEGPDEEVMATDDFDHLRSIYDDTYRDISDEEFQETVADLFGLSPDEAASYTEQYGLSRHGVATFLALRSYLEDLELAQDTLLLLTGIAAQVGAGSPVPADLRELTDDDYEAFIEDNGDAVVFVFQNQCLPCEEMKSNLDEILAPLSDVAVAGVNGDAVPEFQREFELEAAPTTLVFADGELVASERGVRSPAELAETFAEHYETASS